MGRKRYSKDRIIRYIRQAKVLSSQGRIVPEICREIEVTSNIYYRWCKEHKGMGVDEARRLKELERENKRLKRAVAELTLDKLILKETSKGNF